MNKKYEKLVLSLALLAGLWFWKKQEQQKIAVAAAVSNLKSGYENTPRF